MRHVFLFAALLVASGCAEPAQRQPNVVIILADDLGIGDPGRYNAESKIPTPHIDRLADEGMRFGDAHSPSSVCTPTRYGLLTGRYAWRTRLKRWVTNGWSPNLIDTTRLTLPKLLKDHDYVTGAVGKWHLGLGLAETVDYTQRLRPGPIAIGFDYFYGIPASLDFDPYVFVENEGVVELPTDTIEASAMRRHGGGGFWRAGPIAPGFRHADVLPVTTEKAVAFIEEHATEPFFLYVALPAPHTPWLPGKTFEGRSGAGPYGDFVAQVDHTVGTIAGALDRMDIADETLFVFTSDNGAHWLPSDIEAYKHYANADWRGQKADIWEGGHRVPFIVRWPGVVGPGTQSARLVSLTDVMATVAAMLGIALPQDAGEDSYNFLPALRGEDADGRAAMVHHSGDGMFAVREGQWKLILGRGSGGFTRPARHTPDHGEPIGQLYNLESDPGEQHNRYMTEPAIVARLTTHLKEVQVRGRSRP